MGTVLIWRQAQIPSFPLLLWFTVLCDFISAVSKFTVRVLQLPGAVVIHDVALF
jgi:hypothetical protein